MIGEALDLPRRALAAPLDNASNNRTTFRIEIANVPALSARGAAALARLSPLHYRAGEPATCVALLIARDPWAQLDVGLLQVSMPTLNGSWRAHAWPDVFGPSFARYTATSRARTVNMFLRTISRVIVDPRYRGLGVARRLVSAYLDNPITPLTETLAAMGRWCPFFTRAGMREVPWPVSRRDAKFTRALAAHKCEAWQLADLDACEKLLRDKPTLRHALRAWALASKSTRRHAGDAGARLRSPRVAAEMLVLAGANIAARPLVFVTP
ncbi:hypothetical protein LBMAG48_02070 [Phycisphaerae bacterium]|nr:hypothetical protein LBMAG48_02070 [Phycisphaerae bacterium]